MLAGWTDSLSSESAEPDGSPSEADGVQDGRGKPLLPHAITEFCGHGPGIHREAYGDWSDDPDKLRTDVYRLVSAG